MRANESESILSSGQYVRAPIVIFLQNLYDHRGPAGLRHFSFASQHDAERRLRVEAFARHLPVARLKNVQWNGLAGEQNDVQRKERDARGIHERLEGMIAEV